VEQLADRRAHAVGTDEKIGVGRDRCRAMTNVEHDLVVRRRATCRRRRERHGVETDRIEQCTVQGRA
jgi:hypothetical protein